LANQQNQDLANQRNQDLANQRNQEESAGVAKVSPRHRLRGLLLTNDLPGPRRIEGDAFNLR
jgi:hypothetical protein